MSKIFTREEIYLIEDYLWDRLLWNPPTQATTEYLIREVIFELKSQAGLLEPTKLLGGPNGQ